MGIDIGIIVTIGLSFISILLTINLAILKNIGKRIDRHEKTFDERGEILRDIERRITILETKSDVKDWKK